MHPSTPSATVCSASARLAMANPAIILTTLGIVMMSCYGLLTWPGWPRGRPWGRSETVDERLHRVTDRSVLPICEISGVAGMSVGILHRGKVIFRENLGLRKAGGDVAPDSTTIYNIGSLTKAFSAVALTNLLDEHPNITLDTPVDEILPDYVPRDERLRSQVSLGDFLSHCSGLLGDMSYAVQGQFECLLPKSQLLPTVSRLPTMAPLRREWSYNNWGYAIAGAVIEKLSGESYATFLEKSVLRPLGLEHTTSQPNFGPDDNFADAHISLCNATALPISRRYFFKDTFFEPAGGIYSSVNDMMKWAKAVLSADRASSQGPLRHIPALISNQIPLDQPSREFRFYGMGWIRTQLPGVVGLQGDNPEFIPIEELPILGSGAPAMTIYYHQGSAPGYYSALFLFPETESAIVVLTNSIPLNDAADWIAQTYISALFDFPNPADYVALAKESRNQKVADFDQIQLTLNKTRRHHQGEVPRLPLASYAGSYANDGDDFLVDIRQHPQINTSLLLRFQGKETQAYELRHLRGDAFEWGLTCEESAQHARLPILDPKYYEVHFEFESNAPDGGQSPTSLTWAAITGVIPDGLRMHRLSRAESENKSGKTKHGKQAPLN
ncbi:beta-lactamase/transpeptidase-like protein [Bombardia bombarda]|uniref:Beta-lactamase/transpeptidase-like protein n=1 Tax=Bombardia bombarda TaxID=252184 RepID=A0AA40CFB0_9PEZI|nr:beta-lactamase/transpeptidase-like protein [Bombardia bombarda]